MLWPQIDLRRGQSIKVYVGEPIEERLDNLRHEVFQRERWIPRIIESETCLTRGIEVQVIDRNVIPPSNRWVSQANLIYLRPLVDAAGIEIDPDGESVGDKGVMRSRDKVLSTKDSSSVSVAIG